MKKIVIGGLAGLGLVMGLVGCKPTEGNYRSAYDSARYKREHEAAERDSLAALGIVSAADFDAPRWQRLASGDSVLSKRRYLRQMDGDSVPVKPYAAVISLYAMKTNANAHASRLRHEGFPHARVLMSSEPKYYVAIGEFETLEDGAKVARDYEKKYPEVRFVGLPEHPVVFDTGHR